MSEEVPSARLEDVAKPADQLRPIDRLEMTNMAFVGNLEWQRFEHGDFKRCEAKKVTFRNVSFLQSVFKECYFRNCTFDRCDFTGARFEHTILRGCVFARCSFDYARFAHSLVPLEVLERNMPVYENVALELARSLRVNYAQMGDSEGVNKAIVAELLATRVHLWKAAWSPEHWYREKYKGLDRAWKVFEHISFTLFHWLWGNGESWLKLWCTMMVTYTWVAICIWWGGQPFLAALYWAALVFWGVAMGAPASAGLIACATALRLVLLSLLVTLLVRRLSRR